MTARPDRTAPFGSSWARELIGVMRSELAARRGSGSRLESEPFPSGHGADSSATAEEASSTRVPDRGRVLSGQGFQEETRRFFQGRLRTAAITGSIVLGLHALLLLCGAMLRFARPELDGFEYGAGIAATSLALVLFLSASFLLSARELESRFLAGLDALALWTCFALLTWLAAAERDLRVPIFTISVAIVAQIILMRAVLVPSSVLRTLLLSAPAPLAFLALDLGSGPARIGDGAWQPLDRHVVYCFKTQLVLWSSVFVAALASYWNLSLRRRTWEAQSLGHYRLIEPIGRGAMGEVYRATHSMLKRPTAIKFMHPHLGDPAMLRRFEHEVVQASRLDHPNTVSVFDYGRTADGLFYYAMELLEGADLRRIVELTGPLPAARTIHVLVQVLGALEEAHGLELIHRDIKPANIMLCSRRGRRDVVKLLDYGLVKSLCADAPQLTARGVAVGTPETIAPEVIQGGVVDARTDLYSLGAVGYHLLSGAPVFPRVGVNEVLLAHCHAEPAPLSSRAPVPADVEEVVMRCLRKDPAERFASAAEMRKALLACADARGWSQEDADRWWDRHGSELHVRT